MANPFYTYSGAFIPGTLARAEQVGVEYQSVQAGFAILAIQGTDSGAADAYVVTTTGGPSASYADGNIVEFKAKTANTGAAATINVNGIGAVGLTNFQGGTLASGAIVANTWYRVIYNSTYSAFTLIAPSSTVITSNTISAAAPTFKVGLTAAGGVSTAVAPIDAVYALDQGIVPTWTGSHTFANTVTFNSTVSFAGGLSLTGAAGQYAATLTGSSTAGSSRGVLIKAGVNASDIALLIQSQSGGTTFVTVGGTGGVQIGAPTGGDKGVGTINAQALYVNNAAVLTSSVSSANPSATIGLAAVNGSAVTFMTSDSAPPLSQAIAPTWTAAHVFTPSSAVTAVTINAAVNLLGLSVVGSTNNSLSYLVSFATAQGAGFSSGLLLKAGTNSSDNSILIQNAAATATLLQLKGDGSGALGYNGANSVFSWAASGLPTLRVNATSGYWTFNDANASADRGYLGYGSGVLTGAAQADMVLRAQGVLWLAANGNLQVMKLLGQTAPTIQGWGPVAAALVDMTPDGGSFTVTYTGMSSVTTGTATWTRYGRVVVLTLPSLTGTSNVNTFTITGLPAVIQPATLSPTCSTTNAVSSGSASQVAYAKFAAGSGTITMFVAGVSNGWGATSLKGFDGAPSLTYSIQ